MASVPVLTPSLSDAGFDAVGVLAAERYDALVAPAWRSRETLATAASAIVLGCGGPALFRAVKRSTEAHGADPVDTFVRRVVGAACSQWRAAGAATVASFYDDRRDESFLDFTALAVAAGLGAPSRLGLLLHPRFGPWWSIRAVLLTERHCEPTAPVAGEPCEGCPAPCASACPSERVFLPSGFERQACFEVRGERSDCRSHCAARRACVVGREHAYDLDAERHHMRAAWSAWEHWRASDRAQSAPSSG